MVISNTCTFTSWSNDTWVVIRSSAEGRACGCKSGKEERTSRRVSETLAWRSLMPKSAAFLDRRSGAHDNGRSSSCVIENKRSFLVNENGWKYERAYRRIRILDISFVPVFEQGRGFVTKLYLSGTGHTPYA